MIDLFVSFQVIFSGFAAVARRGFRSVKCRVRNISSAGSTTITFLRAVKKFGINGGIAPMYFETQSSYFELGFTNSLSFLKLEAEKIFVLQQK